MLHDYDSYRKYILRITLQILKRLYSWKRVHIRSHFALETCMLLISILIENFIRDIRIIFYIYVKFLVRCP